MDWIKEGLVGAFTSTEVLNGTPDTMVKLIALHLRNIPNSFST